MVSQELVCTNAPPSLFPQLCVLSLCLWALELFLIRNPFLGHVVEERLAVKEFSCLCNFCQTDNGFHQLDSLANVSECETNREHMHHKCSPGEECHI